MSFHTLSFPAQKRGSKRASRDMAHLQAHEVSEAGEPRTSANTSEEIPVSHLRVSPLTSRKLPLLYTSAALVYFADYEK